MPPWAFQYLANALTASTLPWNRPGASGDPTSAITWMVMSVAVTPTSLAWSVPWQADEVAAVVAVVSLVPDEPLRPQPAATSATARTTKYLDVFPRIPGLYGTCLPLGRVTGPPRLYTISGRRIGQEG